MCYRFLGATKKRWDPDALRRPRGARAAKRASPTEVAANGSCDTNLSCQRVPLDPPHTLPIAIYSIIY